MCATTRTAAVRVQGTVTSPARPQRVPVCTPRATAGATWACKRDLDTVRHRRADRLAERGDGGVLRVGAQRRSAVD